MDSSTFSTYSGISSDWIPSFLDNTPTIIYLSTAGPDYIRVFIFFYYHISSAF